MSDSPRNLRRSVFVASVNLASDNRASSGSSSSNLISGRVSSMSVLSSTAPVRTQSVRHRRKLNRLKTNAARLLDSLGIAYEIREYEVDEDDLSAERVAKKVSLPPEQVFKTLVARGDRNGVCFAVVPAGTRLDRKARARLTGDKKIDSVRLREVQPLPGYLRGGVTVLGAKTG